MFFQVCRFFGGFWVVFVGFWVVFVGFLVVFLGDWRGVSFFFSRVFRDFSGLGGLGWAEVVIFGILKRCGILKLCDFLKRPRGLSFSFWRVGWLEVVWVVG